MPGPTPRQIAALFNTALWLKWQAQRRNPDYRSAVAQFLRNLRRDIGELTSQRQALQARGLDLDTHITIDMTLHDRLAACQRVLLAYLQVKSHLRQFEATLTPAEHHALANSEGGKYAEINHTVMAVLAPCLAQDILDQVPALTPFVTAWSVRFPLPPRLPWVITEAFRDTIPIRIVSVDDTQHTLLIEAKFDTDFPLQVVTDFFELHYSAYSPQRRSRWGGTSARRLQALDYYRDVFRVYDLRKRHLSFAAIARHLWPDEFARAQRPYPNKNLTVQRAQDHLKTAERLVRPKKK